MWRQKADGSLVLLAGKSIKRIHSSQSRAHQTDVRCGIDSGEPFAAPGCADQCGGIFKLGFNRPLGFGIAGSEHKPGAVVIRSVITDDCPPLLNGSGIYHPLGNLTQVFDVWSNADLCTDVACEVGASIKVSGVGFRLWIMNVRVCPLRKMIRLVRPKTLQVCPDIKAKRIRLTVVRLTGTELPRADDQNL